MGYGIKVLAAVILLSVAIAGGRKNVSKNTILLCDLIWLLAVLNLLG